MNSWAQYGTGSTPVNGSVEFMYEECKRLDCNAKSKAEAQKWRDTGAQHYQNKRYRDAFQCFMNGALSSPPTDELLGVNYANAAASLLSLDENYPDILLLLDAAEQGHYPKDKLAKLEERRQAVRSRMQSSASSSPVTTPAFSAVDIQPKSSPKTKIADSPQYGRHMISTEDIAEGEELLCNYKPYASALFKHELDAHCHNCFQPLLKRFFVGCDKCLYARYCSVQCRQEDTMLHNVECGRYMFTAFPDEILIAVRVLLRHFLEEKSDQPATEYEIIDALLTHESDRKPEEIEDYVHDVNFILDANRWLKDFGITPGKLYHHCLQVQTNCHAVFYMTHEKSAATAVETTSQLRVGFAFYGLPSLFNHSCRPNATVYYQRGNRLAMRAISPIVKGEQIFISYGTIDTLDFTDRQELLKDKYFFDCKCTACVEDEASGGKKPESKASTLDEAQIQAQTRLAYDLEKEAIEAVAEAAESPAVMHLLTPALTKLHKVMDIRTGLYGLIEPLVLRAPTEKSRPRQFTLDLARVHDLIGRVHALQGSYDLSAKHCAVSLKLLQKVIPAGSVELGNEHLKYASVLLCALVNRAKFDAEMCGASIFHAVEAEKAFRKEYGDGSEDLKEALDIQRQATELQMEAAKRQSALVQKTPAKK